MIIIHCIKIFQLKDKIYRTSKILKKEVSLLVYRQLSNSRLSKNKLRIKRVTKMSLRITMKGMIVHQN